MRHESEPIIDCPIFHKQEAIIKEIINKINRVQGIKEKAALAEELEKEANVLLSCSDYDSDEIDCKNCEFVADLRKKTAGLINRARKLS